MARERDGRGQLSASKAVARIVIEIVSRPARGTATHDNEVSPSIHVWDNLRQLAAVAVQVAQFFGRPCRSILVRLWRLGSDGCCLREKIVQRLQP